MCMIDLLLPIKYTQIASVVAVCMVHMCSRVAVCALCVPTIQPRYVHRGRDVIVGIVGWMQSSCGIAAATHTMLAAQRTQSTRHDSHEIFTSANVRPNRPKNRRKAWKPFLLFSILHSPFSVSFRIMEPNAQYCTYSIPIQMQSQEPCTQY